MSLSDHVKHTHRTAIHFINDIKDLLLAFSLPLVLVDVTGGNETERGRSRMDKNIFNVHLSGAETSRQ